MSNQLAIRLKWDPLRTLAFGSISGTYTQIGTSFTNMVRIWQLWNITDVALIFTDDITVANGKWVLPSNAGMLIDVGANAVAPAYQLAVAKGDGIWVKGAPSTGAVYLSVGYANNANNMG